VDYGDAAKTRIQIVLTGGGGGVRSVSVAFPLSSGGIKGGSDENRTWRDVRLRTERLSVPTALLEF